MNFQRHYQIALRATISFALLSIIWTTAVPGLTLVGVLLGLGNIASLSIMNYVAIVHRDWSKPSWPFIEYEVKNGPG